MGSINPPGRAPVYTDEFVMTWIKGYLTNENHDQSIAAMKLLRVFRDTPGMHCEQERFRRLVARVRA